MSRGPDDLARLLPGLPPGHTVTAQTVLRPVVETLEGSSAEHEAPPTPVCWLSDEPAGVAEADPSSVASSVAARILSRESAHLALVPARRSADSIALAGWTPTDDEAHFAGALSAVVRTWEDLDGARAIAVGRAISGSASRRHGGPSITPSPSPPSTSPSAPRWSRARTSPTTPRGRGSSSTMSPLWTNRCGDSGGTDPALGYDPASPAPAPAITSASRLPAEPPGSSWGL